MLLLQECLRGVACGAFAGLAGALIAFLVGSLLFCLPSAGL